MDRRSCLSNPMEACHRPTSRKAAHTPHPSLRALKSCLDPEEGTAGAWTETHLRTLPSHQSHSDLSSALRQGAEGALRPLSSPLGHLPWGNPSSGGLRPLSPVITLCLIGMTELQVVGEGSGLRAQPLAGLRGLGGYECCGPGAVEPTCMGLWEGTEALLVVPLVRTQGRDLVPSAPDNTWPLRF